MAVPLAVAGIGMSILSAAAQASAARSQARTAGKAAGA